MELSEFLHTRKPYPSLPDDYKESAEREESQYFNTWIKKYPEGEHEEIVERLKYIRLYALRFPDFDGEQWVPSQDAISYYDNREQRIEDCGLSEVEFYEFEILQDAIKELGLSPIATSSQHLNSSFLYGENYPNGSIVGQSNEWRIESIDL